jgi:adenosylhomocysteinase
MRLQLSAELEKYKFCLPIMSELETHLKQRNHLSGKKIGWHCHLTEITAVVAEVLINCGAQLFMSECDPNTTNMPSVEFMREIGATIYLGADAPDRVLEHKPQILSDTGLALVSRYLAQPAYRQDSMLGASEITTSGISRLRQQSNISFPVININCGQLKTYIENFHGVGEGLVDALFQLTGRVWSGRKVAVAGYGSVGSGVASYLRRIGAVVSIVEIDPVRRLIAHYDGYALSSLEAALASSELLVTATGKQRLINRDHFKLMKDGIILINVGHWSSEIDVDALKSEAEKTRSVSRHLEELMLDKEKHIYIAGGGSPTNVAMLSGSCEPTLIHLATEALCMNYLTELEANIERPFGGEIPIPPAIERQASILALKALGLG